MTIAKTPRTGWVNHTKTPPSIQIPTYVRSRRPVNTTNEGPSAKRVSVTNCLRIVFKLRGLKKVFVYMLPKTAMSAIHTMMTGCILKVCLMSANIDFFLF
jgi:hypothetical protein